MRECASSAPRQRVTIGDVIERVNDRRSDPASEGFTHFVGVDDLDPDDLMLRRWGVIADGDLPPTFRYAFPAGAVLFPTRRPALRKCALAPFPGITGEKILILQSRDPSKLDPTFMQFLLASEGVREWVIGRAIGSVTPHFRWRDLADFELVLPCLEEQRRIAGVLTATTRVTHMHEQAAATAGTVADAFLLQRLKGETLGNIVGDAQFGEYSGKLPLTPVDDLVTATQYGLSEPAVSGGRFRMLRMMDLADGVAVESDSCLVDLSEDDFKRYRLERGDVLFNRTNSYELVGRTGVYKLTGDHVFASYLIRLKTKAERLIPEYLSAFLNAPVGRRQVMRFATRAVSQTNVNASNLRTVLIPLPPIDYQHRVVEFVGHLRETSRAHQKRANEAADLGRRIADGMLRSDK